MARCPRIFALSALFATVSCVGVSAESGAPNALRGSQPTSGSSAALASGPCVVTGPEVCFNATDDNCNGLLDEGCGVRTGQVQFMAAWSEASVDVDLEVIDPFGEAVEVGHVNQSGLTQDQDCPGKQSLCYGQNYENVYLESGAPVVGDYQVRVRLVALANAEPPIVVRIGARIGGTSHAAVARLDRDGDETSFVFPLKQSLETSSLRSPTR